MITNEKILTLSTTNLILFNSFRGSFQSRSVNANWQIFKNPILNLEKQYIPTIFVKLDPNNHWFNKQLKSLLNRKKNVFRGPPVNAITLYYGKNITCEPKHISRNYKKPKINIFHVTYYLSSVQMLLYSGSCSLTKMKLPT